MVYNVYEYRLREINMMLGAIGTEETDNVSVDTEDTKNTLDQWI